MLVHLDTIRPLAVKQIAAKDFVTFTKAELNAILSLYSYQVAKNNWRDYAIDFLKQMAVFSIFRHAHETPLVSITKTPGNTQSGYIYEVFHEKKRLNRSAELSTALQALRKDIL